MKTISLETLTIEYLRGSVVPFTLSFERGRKLTLIYGENGTGKTTICDAFEFLGKGTIGSLDNRGLGRTIPYWHSLGKKATDVRVALKVGDVTHAAKFQKGTVVVEPLELRPRVEVLRRNQILGLVEARPADRYSAIRRFIDVSQIEASEESLKTLIRDLERNQSTSIAIIQENKAAIEKFWESVGNPGNDPIEWAEVESKKDLSHLKVQAVALRKLAAEYRRVSDALQRLKTASAALTVEKSKASTLSVALDLALESEVRGTQELLRILETAKAYLHTHQTIDKCPLCESEEKVHGLMERVDERLDQFAGLQRAKRAKQESDQSVLLAEKKRNDLQQDLELITGAFEAAKEAFSWSIEIKLPSNTCPNEEDSLEAWLRANADLPDSWEKVGQDGDEKRRFVDLLRESLHTYRSNLDGQTNVDALLPRLKRALEIMVAERRGFVDSVLETIASEVARLYEIVHPGEGLNQITLELDDQRRASLEIVADFSLKQKAPPQAYYSQSHLDTLGLCIFLALAAKDNPDQTILVLDDVLASIDEPHVERLIEMLYIEAMKFRHCIITTHYRPWKQKLRWGWLQNGQCQFVELAKWSIESGLGQIRSLPDVERLRQLLDETPPDPQLVCAKAGVILEATLDFLTTLYECRVHRRADGLYTLGDLLPAIDKKLKQALRVEVLKEKDKEGKPVYENTSLAPFLDELTRISQARNVFGAHFSMISFDLLEGDAIQFGLTVLSLAEVLTDPNVGWPRQSKSGSYWCTQGETRRLHPLRQPQ
ncbi:MAG: AAA family ATPase [Leptonema illini]|uniref:AAA family ATPase n=1 Tax=Leptonema illini TaxID=183 RepID=A0A833LZ65_9LEPT|nr:MAG: AAA family ATPase [Leptonema illini]